MNQSHANPPARGQRASSVKGARRFTNNGTPDLFSAHEMIQRGCMNDEAAIRDVIYSVLKDCTKSRDQIADEMSWLTARKVTVRFLNGVTAESQDEYRWNADLDRAFCFVTGDDRLLTCRAEAAGLHVVDAKGWELLEYGRAILRQKREVERAAILERSLQEVELG